MQKIFSAFLRRFTFQRQLGVAVAGGILFLALSSSLVGSWQGNERIRSNLLEQGQRITENLARQSVLALIYASTDNAAESANSTLAFPDVIWVEIRDVNRRVLLARGNAKPAELPERVEKTGDARLAAVLEAENALAWRFTAPVYSQPSGESPFHESVAPELLGQVSVVISKKTLSQLTTDIFAANLTASFSFALIFLVLIRFLTNRMTQPLTQLSASMGLAEAGEPRVRAELNGPKDIADMAQAFNSMMVVLEEREAELRQLNETLEQRVTRELGKNREKDHMLIQQSRLAAMGEMVHNIAHQWRQPLNTLGLIVQNLRYDVRDGLLTNELMDRTAAQAMQVIQGMSRTIDDFRNFFRPDQVTCDFDISHAVRQSLGIIGPALDNHHIKVETSFEMGLLAHGHPSQFSQVVLNILANAKEAILSHKVSDGRISIRLAARDGWAVLEIEDNGGGIPDGIIAKIFDPYFTSKEQGSGIGLYMSKTIIERNMDGRIEAANTSAGAFFSVRLPLLLTAEA